MLVFEYLVGLCSSVLVSEFRGWFVYVHMTCSFLWFCTCSCSVWFLSCSQPCEYSACGLVGVCVHDYAWGGGVFGFLRVHVVLKDGVVCLVKPCYSMIFYTGLK